MVRDNAKMLAFVICMYILQGVSVADGGGRKGGGRAGRTSNSDVWPIDPSSLSTC